MPKQLLFSVTKKDLDITTFTGSGPGGQHRNRVQTAVRIVHRASGAVGVASDNKSQHVNIKAAFVRMTETKEFKLWHRLETAKHMGQKRVDQIVDEMLLPRNLKTECKDEKGRWVKFESEEDSE